MNTNSLNDMKDFKLENYKKIASGFKTPDGYFENFTEKVMLQLPGNEPKVISIFYRLKKWMPAVAAVFVLALVIPLYYISENETEDLNTTDMENYITYQSNISQYDLIDLLDHEDIQNLDIDLAIEDQAIEDILTNNNNFENYIYEN